MRRVERLIRDGDASLDVKGRISRRAKDMLITEYMGVDSKEFQVHVFEVRGAE